MRRTALVVVSILLVALTIRAARGGIPDGYYDSAAGLTGEALRLELHEIIDDHTRYDYSGGSTDTWDIVEDACEDPNNAGNVRTIYKNASRNKSDHSSGSGWNREHVWPNSYGFSQNGNSNYPYTDCHHLWSADHLYNNYRANLVFADRGGSSTEYPVDGSSESNWGSGTGSSGQWETWLDRRGDAARTILYMDVRYEGGTHGGTGASEPDLIVTDDRSLIVSNGSSNFSPAYMGLLTTLIQWHLDDPVDDFERQHNEVVYSYQGNRNPFVDHPEWVEAIWADDGGGDGGDPPEQLWINEFHYDNSGSDSAEGIEVCGPAGSLTGFELIAYNGSTGLQYDSVALSGSIPDQDNGFGTRWFALQGLQNGAPDGMALIDPQGDVIQFLSYEGAMTASDGPAAGMQSEDVGVSESGSTPAGHSLQLAGTGTRSSDFTWRSPASATADQPNHDQSFADTDAPAAPTGLLSDPRDSAIVLDWDDNAESDLAGYLVHRAEFPGGPYQQLNGTPRTRSRYRDRDVVPGVTYFYVVTAVDEAGNQSPDSTEISATTTGTNPVDNVWINELHYENNGPDRFEGCELAAPAGTVLDGWRLITYNGTNGRRIRTVHLSGAIADQMAGYGTRWFHLYGLQNGPADGLALVDPGRNVVQFLSYEGTVTAVDGAAQGLTSVDIGVSESGSTPRGDSLQLTGAGQAAGDFTWSPPQPSTPGQPNANQQFE